ncbi:DNA methyltransferase [Sphingopyxis macrogoltabida]|uniref:site-specific DNA-methyltransferase (adenine-specific) n=1 Tax=Sphingopyxis macrogoltabida TaxID=33050 RepID=A0A0N9V4X8_SPHMC|nr:DNA methyltransferase [Sphingopyxis macrogoltabida]ALH82926.1 DNA methylase N-4 [Sphingopyxis macrogoltabida]
MTAENYQSFLEAKMPAAPLAGLPCTLDEVPTHLIDGRPVKDHQRHIVRWAVEGGRRAIFAAFGLGKSIMQLLILQIILRKVGCGALGLIVAPLGVRMEFMKDAALLGLTLHFVRTDAEIDAIIAAADPAETHLFITNYESVREGKISVGRFTVASLDEASVLRSYGSKTFQEFLPLFEAVPYRFVATATPSPNRYKELIHYAGFLGIMDTGQALTRFFQRNSEKANDLQLYPHKEDEFFLWLNTWGVFVQTPSDLGFSDEGYDLPPIEVRWHCVETDISDAGADTNGQGRLIRDNAVGVVEASREKRRTLDARIAKVAEIMAADPADHFLIWHDLEDERRAIEALDVPGRDRIAAVYGSQDLDTRETIVGDFSDGRIKDLAAKPVMLGSGTNLQRHCHREIFAGIGHKFNDFIQAIFRVQRFGQTEPVIVDCIYAETEEEVRRVLLEKWALHEELTAKMSAIIRRYGLNHAAAADLASRSIGVERAEASGEGWTLAHNDCVEEARLLADDSLDLIVTSIPFSNHYEYTPSYNDFGHTDDDAHFFAQMDYLTPELFRALRPGRLACIHVKDRILFGAVTGEGVPTVNPFHAKTLFHYQRHGFQFMGMITVITDVVRENKQTYRLSYSEMLKDGTKMGAGSPEYILLMRKPQTDRSRGYADNRVNKVTAVKLKDGRRFEFDDPEFEEALNGAFGAVDTVASNHYSLAQWQIDAHAFWRSSGNRPLMPSELADHAPRFAEMGVGPLVKAFTTESRDMVYDAAAHVAIGETIEARDKNDGRGHLPRTFMSLAPGSHHPDVWDDVIRMKTLNQLQVAANREKHVCPLQFDIVDRLIDRFSMKGDLVYDPFCGLGTVPMRAILKGRRGAGSELNPDYFRDSCSYLSATEREIGVPSLFDLLDMEQAA